MREDQYGEFVKCCRLKMGLTQNQVAEALKVTPGFISNVENGRTAMSLRVLIYYAKLMNMSLDSMVGQLEPEYRSTSLDREIMEYISALNIGDKQKLLDTLKIWKSI